MKKIFILLILLSGCAPKMIVKNLNSGKNYPTTKPYESFAFIERDTVNFQEESYIAEIEIKDNGLSMNCDYETVKKLAKAKAEELGGNCIVIKEHKLPNGGSTCHRIKCDILRIDNPEKFEKNIIWHSKRKLKISDFKGSTEKRPFQAMTATLVRFYTIANPLNGKAKIIVETSFNCDLSYFKKSKLDSQVLEHEQLHFDIAEIYARKFLLKVKKETNSYQDFISKHENIFSTIQNELFLKQDEYDTEVYADTTLQGKWSTWVKMELEKYKDLENKEFEF